jgi:secreted trypsin-like serine protease
LKYRILRRASALMIVVLIVLNAGSQPTAQAIIGGTQVTAGQYPWMAALVRSNDGSQFCGGSLISNQWVLTAGHCFFNPQNVQDTFANDVQILLGTLNVTDGSGTLINVAEVRFRPGFVNGTNDIALLRLETPADLNDPNIGTMPLIHPADEATLATPNARATIAGWGATNPNGTEASNLLLNVTVPIVSKAVCNPGNADPAIDDNLLCAGGQEGLDSCSGDSGGPLFVPLGGTFVQVGLSHAGPDPCAQNNAYGLYTRVAQFSGWITEQTGVAPLGPLNRLYIPSTTRN